MSKATKLRERLAPHIKLLVLTEYWKVVDSQSGRQSHWVADTFLIALKNLGVSSRLRGRGELLEGIHSIHLQVLL